MSATSLALTCKRHNQLVEVLLFLPTPTNTQDNNNNLALKYCCSDCLMEIPPKERIGLSCLYLQDINTFFRKISQSSKRNHLNLIVPSCHNRQRVSKLLSNLINLYKVHFNGVRFDENLFEKGLQTLIRPFHQELYLEVHSKINLGDSEFPSEFCCDLPDKPCFLIGNRSGEVFVLHKEMKKVIKTLQCPNRIGAMKYIPQRKTIIVVGLGKFITKIDSETLEIIESIKPQSSSTQNFMVVEYIHKHNLLILGGYNMGKSLEFRSFQDGSLVKTMNYEYSTPRKIDELWASKSTEEGRLIVLGFRSGLLQIWDTRTLKMVHQVQTMSSVTTLEYHSEKKFIYAGHRSGEISIWSIFKGRLYKIKAISTGTMTLTKFRFLNKPFSKYLIVSNFSKTLSIWDSVGRKIDVVNVFEEHLKSVFIFDNSMIIAIGLKSGVIDVLQIKTFQDLKPAARFESQKVKLKYEGDLSKNCELVVM